MRVIIDTDAGIDDAWSILMLLAASGSDTENLTVSGITCVHGNAEVEQVCINVLRTLEAANRLDIPVFKGASLPLIDSNYKNDGKPFFGADGFGGAEHKSTPDLRFAQAENAITALSRLADEEKGNVSLLCFGPLTNIALAIRTFPSFEENLKEILIMGGNYMAVGNKTNCAEFNFYADPEAACIVLGSAIKRKVVVPWETCCQMAFSLDWRDNVLGSCDNTSVQLMNHAERPLRHKVSFVDWMPCDQVVAAVFLDPSVVTESTDVYATVELQGQHTRGQVVLGHKCKEEPNVTIVKSVDKERFARSLLKVHTLK